MSNIKRWIINRYYDIAQKLFIEKFDNIKSVIKLEIRNNEYIIIIREYSSYKENYVKCKLEESTHENIDVSINLYLLNNNLDEILQKKIILTYKIGETYLDFDNEDEDKCYIDGQIKLLDFIKTNYKELLEFFYKLKIIKEYLLNNIKYIIKNRTTENIKDEINITIQNYFDKEFNL
jgi:triacylglycerol esterase/lipase EstA (alpha/beta hydrolase family)